MPLTPKKIGASSIIVIKRAVRACCSGLKPGAITWAINGREKSAASSANTVVIASTNVITALASRHAGSSPRPDAASLVSRAVKVGMKAEASAPPATR